MWWHFVSGSASLPQIKEAVWPCSIILCLLLVSPRFCRTLGGVQKSCWTQLSTWATSASATWNTSPSLSPPQPTLPSHSCLSTPTSSTHPPSPCTPTRASPPRFLRRRSSSPRSNPCDMPHNFSLCKRQHDSATKKKKKRKKLHGKLWWADVHPSPPRFCLFSQLNTCFHSTWWKCESPVLLCTACSTLRLSVGPSSPCDVSIADTDSPLPPLVPFTPHTPTHPVCFLIASSPLNMLIFYFYFIANRREQNCITQDVIFLFLYFLIFFFFFFFFFTFPTVVVTFYSNVLLFRLFSCFVFFFVRQSYACFFESRILNFMCDRVCSGENKKQTKKQQQKKKNK